MLTFPVLWFTASIEDDIDRLLHLSADQQKPVIGKKPTTSLKPNIAAKNVNLKPKPIPKPKPPLKTKPKTPSSPDVVIAAGKSVSSQDEVLTTGPVDAVTLDDSDILNYIEQNTSQNNEDVDLFS